MRYHRLGVLILPFLILVSGLTHGADPVALVTDLEGSVTRTNAGQVKAVNLLDELNRGTRLKVAPGARIALVYLDSGEEFTSQGPAAMVLAAGGVQNESGSPPQIRRLLSDSAGNDGAKLKPINVAQLSLVMRGSGSGKRAKYLNDTKTLSPHPYFQWTAPTPNARYLFTLTDDTGEVQIEAMTTAGFQLPDSVRLEPGVTYGWEADPQSGGSRAELVWGSFELAEEALRSKAKRLQPGPGATFSERVVYATWLNQNRLRDEARRYWSALAKMRNDDPRLRALAGL